VVNLLSVSVPGSLARFCWLAIRSHVALRLRRTDSSRLPGNWLTVRGYEAHPAAPPARRWLSCRNRYRRRQRRARRCLFRPRGRDLARKPGHCRYRLHNRRRWRVARSYRGTSGRLVRVFAIDLVPELVRTGRAHEEVSAVAQQPSRCPSAHNRRIRRSSKKSARQCRIGAEVFVAGVRGRPRRAPPRRREPRS
jgi:hypothetical protein